MYIFVVFCCNSLSSVVYFRILQNGRRPLLQLLHPNSSRYFSPDDLATLSLSIPSLSLKVIFLIYFFCILLLGRSYICHTLQFDAIRINQELAHLLKLRRFH